MKKTYLLYLLTLVIFSLMCGCTDENENENNTNESVLTDIDGNEYQTVTIGSQVWMKENLKTTKYNNGDPINNITEQSSWLGRRTGAWCNYDNDIFSGNKYGKLYNWYTVKSGMLAPKGWHIPTTGEWQDLQFYANSHYESLGLASKALASKTDWSISENTGAIGFEMQTNNNLGFSALPSGARGWQGLFDFLFEGSYWWCSDEVDIRNANIASLNYNTSEFVIDIINKSSGLSVRCIKDYIHQQPLIDSISVNNLSRTTATISFKIVSNGGELITDCGVFYGISADTSLLNNKLTLDVNNGSVSGRIDDLLPETNYYVKAFATNILGITYSKVDSFTTLEGVIHNEEITNIPAGTFTMGSPTTEVNRLSNETQHSVTLSAFRMSKHEITNTQFADFLNQKNIGSNGVYEAGAYYSETLIYASSGSNDFGLHYTAGEWVPVAGYENMPVINVTWFGATEFAEYAGGKLPTEAQWEYACRAGTSTPFNSGNFLTNLQANYNWAYPYNGGVNTVNVSQGKTQAVGTFAANAFGLYDMHGNVWEWCSDWYDAYSNTEQTNPTGVTMGSYRVFRGGAWSYYAQYCRSAFRNYGYPGFSAINIGFRVVFVP